METPRKPEFSQCFGDKAAPEELTDGGCTRRDAARTGRPSSPSPRPMAADLLTTVEFDETGTYLATGDRGGRVVIFEKGDDFRSVSVQGTGRARSVVRGATRDSAWPSQKVSCAYGWFCWSGGRLLLAGVAG
jgi:hypothetical protein